MHRIDGSGNIDNTFTETAPGTVVTDDWLNDVQENLCTFIEDMGIALGKGDYGQLEEAVTALVVSSFDDLRNTANTWSQLNTFQRGISVTQATTNTPGIASTGNGTGPGGSFTAGTNGHGVSATGGSGTETYAVSATAQGNNHAVVAAGAGTGSGGVFTGGASGPGMTAVPGASGQAAIALGGSNPSSSAGFSNGLTKLNVPKAWGFIDVTSATPTVSAGFNVGSVALSVGSLVVTLATGLSGSSYAVIATPGPHSDGTAKLAATASIVNSSTFLISLRDTSANAAYSLALNNGKIHFMVFGAQ